MASLKAPIIKPGTTPLLSVVVDGEDIQDATIYVTVETADRKIVKTNYYDNGEVVATAVYDSSDTIIGTEISVQYSQADTLLFIPGKARLEVGWVFEDGSADKSDLARIMIPETLYKGVMAYGRNSSEYIESADD